MFNSFSRSATSGWTVVIGVPKAIMMAEIWRWLWWTIAGTALLSLTGIALALLMARRIAGSIQGLIAPALALGRGEPVTIGQPRTRGNQRSRRIVAQGIAANSATHAEHERAEAARREAEGLSGSTRNWSEAKQRHVLGPRNWLPSWMPFRQLCILPTTANVCG